MSRRLSTEIKSSPSAADSQRPPGLAPDSSLQATLKPLSEDYYAPVRFWGYFWSAIGPEIEKRKILTPKQMALSEAGIFLATNLGYTISENAKLNRTLRAAVGAEFGGGEAGLAKSSNPLIQTAVQRIRMKAISRTIADMTFLLGMVWGITAMAFRVTLERTVFNNKTAYEKLERLFEDVQLYGFNVSAVDKVAKELANVVQQAQKDHGRPAWERRLMESFTPVFHEMAEHIVAKELSLTDATFLIGEVMVKRLSAEESLILLDNLQHYGLQGLARMNGDRLKALAPVAESRAMATVEEGSTQWRMRGEENRNRLDDRRETAGLRLRQFAARNQENTGIIF